VLAPSYPIATERLLLRPLTPADLDGLHALFGRDDVSRYLNWEPMDRERAGALLERRLTQTAFGKEGEGIALALEERATGRFVGEVILRLTSEESRQGEIGWSLHPDAQGKGYATEAGRELLRLGFEKMGLHRIVAECDPRNEASIRVMERLGMRRESHRLESVWLKGEWVGSIEYAMLEQEWRARRPPPAVSPGTAQEQPARCRTAGHDRRRRPARGPCEEHGEAGRE
jgi:RimJ/RimL family protein N-acetyltransferase